MTHRLNIHLRRLLPIMAAALCLIGGSRSTVAQPLTLDYFGSIFGNVSTDDYAPYFIGSLNGGRTTRASSAMADVGASVALDTSRRFSWGAGIEVLTGYGEASSYSRWNATDGVWTTSTSRPAAIWVQQLYGEVKYRSLFARVGQKDNESIILDESLSSGDLTRSSNSRGIPGIAAGFIDFQDIPFTNGWVQISGMIEFGKYTDNGFRSDQFIDIMPDEWEWQPPESINGGEVPPIPIIISKDYLALYNFGFAASRGLPQLSEALVSSIPITLSISGNGRQMKLRAFIVGFSSRLNTIAVPTQFIDWGNEHFADTPPENPSRLILETNSPGDPKIQQFLDDNDYECAGDKTNNGRAAHFLAIITSVVAAVGLVICLLAFFILLLSISLLLQKNRQKNHALMMLGYSPQYVTRYYLRLVVTVNACSLICSIIALIAAQMIWKAPLLNIGISVTPTAPTILVGFIIMVLITIINFIAVSRNVRKAFPRPSTTKAK